MTWRAMSARPYHAAYGFERLNNEVASWMAGKTSQPPKHVLEVGADCLLVVYQWTYTHSPHVLELGLSRFTGAPEESSGDLGCAGELWGPWQPHLAALAPI